MKTFRALAICLTAFALSSASISAQTLEVPDAVIPVVGSTAGGSGANFRTEAQLHNPGDSTIRGKLVFVYQGIPIQPNPPAELEYELTPKETIVYEDLVAAMGGNGLGSIDIFAEVGGVPDMVVRAFDDKGPDGTTGLTVPVLDADLALTPGRNALLVVPTDLIRYRFNIGVRTIPSEQQRGLAHVRVFAANGNQIGDTIEKSFQEIFFAQAAAEDFLGVPLVAGSSVLIEVVEGRMFFYSTTTDNTTNDGSIQIDRLFNLAPVLDDLDIHVMTPAATPVTVPLAPIDPDDDPITSSVGVGPTNGVVEITTGEDGIVEVTYTPEGGFEGDDVFTVVFDDGNGGRTVVTITVTVGGGNSSPTALGNSYSVIEGSTLTVPVPGVLGNDQDPDSDPLTAVLETPPSESSAFSLNADGSFTYTPRGGFVGSDTFTYRANDGQASSNLATVRINVTSSNTPPSAVSDSTSTDEDTPIMVTVLANDTDAETPGSLAIISVNTTGTLGTAMVSGSQITYDPTTSPTLQALAAAASTTDTFQYTIQDPGGLTSTASVTVTVTGVNDAPTITSDGGGTTAGLSVAENQTSVTDVQSTDPEGDIEGSGLTYSKTGGADQALFTLNTSTGVLTFTSAPDFELPGDSGTDNDYEVQVTVTDGGGLTDVQDITVTVTNVNEAPTITSDGGGATAAVSAAENQTAVTDVQSTDPEGDTEGSGLTYTITGGADSADFSIVSTTGVLTFVSAPDFDVAGDANTDNDYEVQVTVTDSGTLTDVQDITVTVTDVNEAPTITSDGGGATAAINAAENQTAVTDVQSTDPEGDTEGSGLTYSKTGGADQALFTLNVNTGALTFTSAPDFETPGDAGADNVYDVQVTVTDSGALTDVQDIAVTVTDANDAPSITSNGGGATAAINAAENQTAVTDVQSTDPEGDTEGSGLTYSKTGGADQALFTLNVNTGVLTFTSAPDFETPGDAGGDNVYDVQVTVTDSGALTDVQDIAVTVTNVNEAPTITSNGGGATAAVNVAENTTAVTDVQATDDSDSEGSGLTYSKTGGADQALFTLNAATGVLAFTSAPDFESPGDAGGNNVYDVQVTVTDSGALTDVQDIAVTVTDGNEIPIGGADSYDFVGNTLLLVDKTTSGGAEVLVSTTGGTTAAADGVLDNDTDDGAISVSGVRDGTTDCADITAPFTNCATANGGLVTMESNGQFSFTPKVGDTAATDTFQYKLTDGLSTVNVTVTLTRKSRVWYVRNNNASGTDDGTSGDPFNTLAEAETASVAGDTIYVYQGDGTTTGQDAGITLKANQRLLGSGVALTVPVAVNGGSSPTTLLAAGTRPLIEHTAGDGVTATDVAGVEIQGLDIKGTTNAIDVSTTAANNGGATISNNVISGAGSEGLDVNADGSGTMTLVVTNNTWSATGNAVDIRRSAGAMTLDFSTNTNIVSSGGGGVFIDGGALASSTITGFSNNTVSGNTVGNGIRVTNVTFNSVSGGTTSVGTNANPVGLGGFALVNVAGSLTFADLSSYASSGTAVEVAGGAAMAFTVQNATNASVAVATGGSAVSFLNVGSTVTFNSLSSTSSGGRGIDLDTVSGTFTVTGATTIASPTGFGIRINASTATFSFGTVNVTNRGTAGINIVGGSATIGFGATTVGAAGAAGTSGVAIDNTTGGSVTFSSLSVNNNGGSGSALAASGNAGAITVTAGSLQGSSGATVSVSSGSGAVSIGATITNTSGRAVQILNNTGGTKTFSAAITDTGGAGVFANSNTGATMTFTGGLTLSTAANAAFTATGGGTVNVTGTNTLTTTTGTALNVASTTIGASGLTFRSISANGAVNGIVLNTTGSSGGLTVTGTGAAGTGGTIQNTTGDAISINNAQDVVLSSITISSPAGDGFDAVNLRGTNRINANSVIEGVNSVVGASGVRVQNTNTNLTLIELDSSTFRNSTSAQAFALFELSGTSNMGVTVKDSTFTNLFAQAVLAAAGQAVGSTGTMTTTVSGNMFVDANTSAGFGENNLGVVVANGATQSATISGNTFDNITKDGGFANSSVLRTQNNGGTWSGTVSGNTIRNINILAGGGRHGIGHVFEPTIPGTGSSTISIIDNDIDNLPDREAIFVDYRGTAGGGSVTIDNNRIGQRVGSVGAIGGFEEAIELRFRQLTAQNVAVLVEDNIVTATTAFSVDQLLDIDAEDLVTLNATVRNNTFTQLGAGTELIELSVEDAGASGCYNVTGNTLSAGGEIDLVHDAGTMNVTQASTAAMSAANGGATVGVGGVTANPTFGSAACSTP